MLAALILLHPAHAMPVAECNAGLVVADTIPGPGTMGVPVDVRPAVAFTDGCSGNSTWTAWLARTDDGEVFAEADTADLAATLLLEVFPAADLEPETAYTLTLTPDGGEAVDVGFTTGLGTVTGLTGEPSVTVTQAQWLAESGELSATFRALPATDPDVLSILQVKDADADRGLQSFVVPPSGEIERTSRWWDSVRTDEVCLQVRQLDGAGVATEWSAPACAEVVEVAAGCGCSTGSPAASLAGLALALGLALRRRA